MDYTADFETQFRPLQLNEGYNPQYIDPEYGLDPHWDNSLEDQRKLQIDCEDYPPTDDEEDSEIPDNIISGALIELWQPNPDINNSEEIEDPIIENGPEAEPGLLDETAFQHVLVTKEGEPAYILLSMNLGLKYKRRMLYFPMDFGELTKDGLMDTRALTSAIQEADLRKICFLAPQSIGKKGTCSNIPNYGRKRTLETPKSTVELKFEAGDIEFHESFFVMETLTGPIFGLMFLQRNHTVLDMPAKCTNNSYGQITGIP